MFYLYYQLVSWQVGRPVQAVPSRAAAHPVQVPPASQQQSLQRLVKSLLQVCSLVKGDGGTLDHELEPEMIENTLVKPEAFIL